MGSIKSVQRWVFNLLTLNKSFTPAATVLYPLSPYLRKFYPGQQPKEDPLIHGTFLKLDSEDFIYNILSNTFLNQLFYRKLMDYLGIDFGCTAIKYGQVSLDHKVVVSEFDMVKLGKAITLEPLAEKIGSIFARFPEINCAGIGLPSIVRKDSIVDTAIPFNALWNLIRSRQMAEGKSVFALNDADAAGMAELYRPEAEELREGVTAVITLGTGIGSAVFHDGVLLPNTELGVIQMHGVPAEEYSAASAKTRENLPLAKWAARLQEYLAALEFILSPDTIILGGGISADFEKFAPELQTRARLLPAYYRNQAGVIGAAMFAASNVGGL